MEENSGHIDLSERVQARPQASMTDGGANAARLKGGLAPTSSPLVADAGWKMAMVGRGPPYGLGTCECTRQGRLKPPTFASR